MRRSAAGAIHLMVSGGQLADLAARDPLTGVLNRSGLDDMVRRHFARRDASPITVLLLDIDQGRRTQRRSAVHGVDGCVAGCGAYRPCAATATRL